MRARKNSSIKLFDYLDYRAYLRDLYAELKKGRTPITFRSFSKKAGFVSPNVLKLVMEGKRNLTEESIPKFGVALELNKQEQEFFGNLVRYNQAKTHQERDHSYQKLLQSRQFNQLKPLEKNQYEYCSEWYHSAVREMVACRDFDGTPEWLASKILPPITPQQAQKSMELLDRLGLIQKTAEGQYRQSAPLVSTGAEVTSVALFNYHMNLLDLAKVALEKIQADKRDISAMTLGVEKGKIQELKKKIQEFRSDVMKLVSTDTHPEAVVQLSIQMFPMSQV